ncbi:MAG: hypothetical protein JST35_04025 [Armatimonadetes bacterium]|nr:hypothetical protein [Armatimonadota bacterium]
MNRALILPLVSLCGLSALSSAQISGEKIGLRVRVGLQFGVGFPQTNNTNGNLNGPEFGLEFPISSNPGGWEYGIAASALLGGSLAGGTDGYVYRFGFTGRKMIGKDAYYRLGIGMGQATPKGNTLFKARANVYGSLSYGFRLGSSPKFLGKTDPFVEITVYGSPRRELSGFGVGLSLGF